MGFSYGYSYSPNHLKSRPFATQPLLDHAKSRLGRISDPHCAGQVLYLDRRDIFHSDYKIIRSIEQYVIMQVVTLRLCDVINQFQTSTFTIVRVRASSSLFLKRCEKYFFLCPDSRPQKSGTSTTETRTTKNCQQQLQYR